MELRIVSELEPGDRFRYLDEKRIRTVAVPRSDVRHTVGINGKEISIVHQSSHLENCADRSMLHLSTDSGVACVHEITRVEMVTE